MDNSIRRNPFWKIIQDELGKAGFTEYTAEHAGSTNNMLFIKGVHLDGKIAEQKYRFPRMCKSFESERNFRSAFRNFVRYELPERNVYPPADHRVRKAGAYIAHINHDMPKKTLTTPKPLLQLVGELKPALLDVVAPPTMPEEAPKLNKAGEPISPNMILATFIVDIKDLSSITDVCEGTAKFHRYRPCPLRLLEQQPVPQPAPAPAPAPVNVLIQERSLLTPKPPVVPQDRSATYDSMTRTWTELPSRIRNRMRTSVQDLIVDRMETDKKREWTAMDFSDLTPSSNSLYAHLSLLNTNNRIKRVALGRYKLSK